METTKWKIKMAQRKHWKSREKTVPIDKHNQLYIAYAQLRVKVKHGHAPKEQLQWNRKIGKKKKNNNTNLEAYTTICKSMSSLNRHRWHRCEFGIFWSFYSREARERMAKRKGKKLGNIQVPSLVASSLSLSDGWSAEAIAEAAQAASQQTETAE